MLVPLDGSGFGEMALSLATAIADRRGSALELVMVHVPSTHPDVSREMAAEIEATLRAQALTYLQSLAEQVRRRFDILVTTTVLDGAVVPAIVRHASAEPPELLVMSTHGRGGPSRFFLGSAADRLVRELHCPVLLVRPTTRLTKGEFPAVSRVLVPLDGSALAESVIDEIARLFTPSTATLRLLRAVAPADAAPISLPVPFPPGRLDVMTHRLEAAGNYLNAVALKLRRIGWQVEHAIAVDSSPSSAVLSHAEAQRCDVIALATRGLGGLQRMVLGSVADKVIRGADIPVLVINPPIAGLSRVLAEASGQAGRPSGSRSPVRIEPKCSIDSAAPAP